VSSDSSRIDQCARFHTGGVRLQPDLRHRDRTCWPVRITMR